MCSIIGYYGSEQAAPILVRALKRMEYRGYDSVGVATSADSKIILRKGTGRVSEVNKKVQLDGLPGSIGIGHTRWATHGMITDSNAHPHASNSGEIAVVHNGIVENHAELKVQLEGEGYTFESETDTEVLANQLQKNHTGGASIKDTMVKTLSGLRGDYAFVAMFGDGTLAAARLHKPLIVGVGKNSYHLSSDVLGFVGKTDDAIYIDNGSFVILDSAGLQLYTFEGTPVKKQITRVSKEFADVYKGSYAHYTIKEISEQPKTILWSGGTPDAFSEAAKMIRDAKNAYITGSGTSYNSALVAQHLMSRHANVKLEPIISSELPHSHVVMDADSILIAISQSGESADVMEAVRIAKKSGAKVLSILNVQTSSLAQESDAIIWINCGPEIGVAATKSFTSQLGTIYRITEELCGGCMKLDWKEVSRAITNVLDSQGAVQDMAALIKDVSDIYVLGRGIHYPIAAEAALKLKELTYVHAEGMPGGELKHGSLALMNPDVHVVVINPEDATYDDMMTSVAEIKSRGARIIGISDKNSEAYDHWIEVPKVGKASYPIVEIVPIQLLSYYLALEKDNDPDYPRNLAKSVTVK